jgi:hypothetical protein
MKYCIPGRKAHSFLPHLNLIGAVTCFLAALSYLFLALIETFAEGHVFSDRIVEAIGPSIVYCLIGYLLIVLREILLQLSRVEKLLHNHPESMDISHRDIQSNG